LKLIKPIPRHPLVTLPYTCQNRVEEEEREGIKSGAFSKSVSQGFFFHFHTSIRIGAAGGWNIGSSWGHPKFPPPAFFPILLFLLLFSFSFI
jgi:hypothetical protein